MAADFSPAEWFQAAAVVNATATFGGLVVTMFVPDAGVAALAVGVAAGAAVGLAINWYTHCPVCRAQMGST